MNDRISVGQAGLNGRRHVLYRFFDQSDVLLYVGITVDPTARFKKHRGDKPWWDQIDHIGLEKFPTRREAEDAERKAIKGEHPLYNVMHNAFVDEPNAGHTDATLACDIVYGHVGIEYGSEEHARLVVQAKANAIEDEREFGGVEAEVANLLVSNLLTELWGRRDDDETLKRCAAMMSAKIPDAVKAELMDRVRHDFYCADEPEPSEQEALPHLVRHVGNWLAEQFGEA
jgi:predicted GIY-YIG superfamily endonuclease